MSDAYTNYKTHSYKLLIWLAIGSIVMMFAAFTSAYIVKKSQENWSDISLPNWFYASTVVIFLSSACIYLAQRFFRTKDYLRFKQTLLASFFTGFLFVVFQVVGFNSLVERGLFLSGNNVASSFLYVIVGLHALHVIGGLIAFVFIILKYFSSKTLYYSEIPLQVFSIYWHFVDLLWLYLLMFFILQTN